MITFLLGKNVIIESYIGTSLLLFFRFDFEVMRKGFVFYLSEANKLFLPTPFRRGFHKQSKIQVPISVGLRASVTPAASRAANLSCAVPLPPAMIAPACPIRLPDGAVTPAI